MAVEPSVINYLEDHYTKILEEYVSPIEAQIIEEDLEEDNDKKAGGFWDAEALWEEMDNTLRSEKFYNLVFVGKPGGGKSTAAREVVHLAMEKGGYELMYILSQDIIKSPLALKEKFKKMVGKRIAIVIEDASYALMGADAKTQAKVKTFFSTIRHQLEESSVILIFIIHTMQAIPPVLRNTNSWIFAKPTFQERAVMGDLIGKSKNKQQELENTFNFVLTIRQAQKEAPTQYYSDSRGHEWKHTLDVDGRMMLMCLEGEAKVYNAKNEFCKKCEFIGLGVSEDTHWYDAKKEEPKQKALNTQDDNEISEEAEEDIEEEIEE